MSQGIQIVPDPMLAKVQMAAAEQQMHVARAQGMRDALFVSLYGQFAAMAVQHAAAEAKAKADAVGQEAGEFQVNFGMAVKLSLDATDTALDCLGLNKFLGKRQVNHNG